MNLKDIPNKDLVMIYRAVKESIEALENEKNKLVEGQKNEGRDPKTPR